MSRRYHVRGLTQTSLPTFTSSTSAPAPAPASALAPAPTQAPAQEEELDMNLVRRVSKIPMESTSEVLNGRFLSEARTSPQVLVTNESNSGFQTVQQQDIPGILVNLLSELARTGCAGIPVCGLGPSTRSSSSAFARPQ